MLIVIAGILLVIFGIIDICKPPKRWGVPTWWGYVELPVGVTILVVSVMA